MTKVLGVTCSGKGKWLIMLAWDKQWPIPGTSSSGDRVGDRQAASEEAYWEAVSVLAR